ncbi:MAG: DMT family transporter [Cyanobacteria bacterium]|nr:DMT family transporter [Cyanobacteriota bacterium]
MFVSMGAALWGTETLWRVFLNKQFVSDVVVLYEHGYCCLVALPFLWLFREALQGIKARVWLFLLGSAVLGSAVGTFFFTESLRTVNLSVANVLLNIQPLFAAFFARVLLKEQFGPGFFRWAFVAITGGALLSLKTLSLEGLSLSGELWMVLISALCWSFGTVAGRVVNTGMSFWVASPLRLLFGLIAMIALVCINGHASVAFLKPDVFQHWQIHQDFLLLSVFAGVLPLFLYFRGLRDTPASLASFCEMAQILAALIVTWGYFGESLSLTQILGALILCLAVARINQIQSDPNTLLSQSVNPKD